MDAVICPRCGRDDLTQRVSAIVTNGVTTVGYEEPVEMEVQGQVLYGAVNKTSATYSDLAQRLLLPAEPEEHTLNALTLIGLALVGSFGGYALLGHMLGELSVGVGIVSVFLSLYLFHYRREFGKAAHAEPVWERAAGKWARLYYCGRDDCVFEATKPVAVKPENMGKLIYR